MGQGWDPALARGLEPDSGKAKAQCPYSHPLSLDGTFKLSLEEGHL